MIVKLAILLVIVLIVAGFASWAFLPARYLPGNRARHLRIRLHLRLHPGKGFAHAFSLWLRWSRFAVLRRSSQIRPALPCPALALQPASIAMFALAAHAGGREAHAREAERFGADWPDGSYGRRNRKAIAARETRVATRLRAVQHAYQAAAGHDTALTPPEPDWTLCPRACGRQGDRT
jgi:hypothetical protein